jgi:hypothetical protein
MDRPTHHDEDPDRLDAAAAEAVGRRIREAAAGVQAPPALRAHVAEQRARAAARRAHRRRPLALGVVAASVVLLALVVVLVGGRGVRTEPSVGDAVALALSHPTAPPPARDMHDEHLTRAQVGGVHFPDYGYGWPRWRTAGTRQDTIAGRAATTVVYRGPSGDVGYTIVAGTALPEPAGARHVTAGGQRLAVLRHGDATVVTWRRGGHTCVLASRAPGAERQLVRFAVWT